MIPLRDLLVITGTVAGAALVVVVTGRMLLSGVRRRSLLISVVLVAVVSSVAVLVGAAAAARAMFLSGHDLRVLMVIVTVAGSVGVGAAVLLSHSVVQGSRALGRAAVGLSDGTYRSPDVPLNAELAALVRQLAEMSQRLQNGRQRERDLEVARRELVVWISHDLRTPLAGIRVMAEALEDGLVADEDSVARYHASIRREADRLSGMVDDLFELSRINANALRLQLQEVAFDDVVSDAVATAQPVAAARGVVVDAHAPATLRPVHGSVPELGRILRNLLSNAVRHTPAGGTVQVVARNDGDNVVVEVRDGCGGIPEADLPRLFEVAFRGTVARTPGEDGGAGLDWRSPTASWRRTEGRSASTTPAPAVAHGCSCPASRNRHRPDPRPAYRRPPTSAGSRIRVTGRPASAGDRSGVAHTSLVRNPRNRPASSASSKSRSTTT